MPPRRSSRSRASVEPPAPAPAKRKRTSPDENQAPTDDEDVKPVIKPQRGTRVSRKLEDVRESDEEQDDSPPVKKSRPSLDNRSVADDSEEEKDEKPSRPRRVAKKSATPAPASMPTRRGRSQVTVKQEAAQPEVIAISSDEEEEEDVAPSKGEYTGRRVPKPADSPSEDEFVDTKPSRRGRGAAPARARRGRGRSSVPPRAAPSRASRRTSSVEPDAPPSAQRQAEHDDSDDSDALSYAEPESARTPKPASKTKPVVEQIPEESEEEEEHSLLEPEIARSPTPKPAAPATALVNEPQGPQARLVIHKMVLVDFKSYAGRQEIGPFHKVRRVSFS